MGSSSSSSSSTEFGPTEDVISALLEYLVDPMLPSRSSVRKAPSIREQQLVAKQVHATVLLYNYYHRKRHPELEFLGFESFCKLAVTLKPSLIMHMNFTNQSDDSKVDGVDLENQFSLTEKAIMDACTVSRALLDASQDVSSSLKEWPITKAAVLLIDSKKENCLMLFTEGVWSVIEKDLDTEDTAVGSKRKRINNKENANDEAGFRQLAFSAIKEATGYNEADLKILKSHVAYSLSKAKTSARFYIVQCTQSISEDLQVPIKEAIESLQGPVVRKISGTWIITPVVEYFHVLPYAGVLSDWFFSPLDRQGVGNVDVIICQSSVKPFEKELGENKEVFYSTLHNTSKMESHVVHTNNSRIEISFDNGATKSRDCSDKKCTTSESVSKEAEGVNISEVKEKPCDIEVVEIGNSNGKAPSGAAGKFLKQKGSNESCMIGFYSSSGPRSMESMDVDESTMICSQKVNKKNSTHMALKVYHHQKKRTPLNKGVEVKEEVAGLKTMSCIRECGDEKFDTEKGDCVFTPHPDGTPTVDRSLVLLQQNTNGLEKVHLVMAAKESELSQTALRALIKKRERLSNQLRALEDEMAMCDRNIQAILDGTENDLALKLEAIVDCCNDICLQDKVQAQDRTNQHVDDQCLPQHVKGKSLSEAILTMQAPCQELDNICRANNWMLPKYRVSTSDGGFIANVTVKGADFEYLGGSNLNQSPREARDSAALQVIAKLKRMAGRTL